MAPVVQLKSAREQPPEERVVASRLPSRNEVEAFVELREHLRDLGRIVLEIGVDGHHELSLSLEEAGLQRGGLSEVPAQMDDDHVRHLVVEPREN